MLLWIYIAPPLSSVEVCIWLYSVSASVLSTTLIVPNCVVLKCATTSAYIKEEITSFLFTSAETNPARKVSPAPILSTKYSVSSLV